MFTCETTEELLQYPERPPASGWAGSSGLQGRRCPKLCCIKAMLRERNRFKRPRAETSCRHHTQSEAFHHISADQVKAAGGFCKDGGVCQSWVLWWDEPDWRAARKASEVGGNVDVVCGADCFLSQLETRRNERPRAEPRR